MLHTSFCACLYFLSIYCIYQHLLKLLQQQTRNIQNNHSAMMLDWGFKIIPGSLENPESLENHLYVYVGHY